MASIFFSQKTFTAQLEHSSIIKNTIQHTEQRGIFVKTFSTESGILVTGDDYVEVGFFVVVLVNQEKLTSARES